MSVSTTNQIKCQTPDTEFESPKDAVKYLEKVEAGFHNSSAKYIEEMLAAPSAFEDCAWDKLPDVEDYDLSNDYKLCGNPAGNTEKKGVDAVNKAAFALLKEACSEHVLMSGLIRAAPFVRYTTFRDFIRSKYGVNTKMSRNNVEEIKAKIHSDPRYPNQLIDLDPSKKVSDGSQTADFFARVSTASYEYKKASGQDHDMGTKYNLIESRFKSKPSRSGIGRRYTDQEWATVYAKRDNLAQLEHVLTNLDLDKEAEDIVDADDSEFSGAMAGGGSLAWLKQGTGNRKVRWQDRERGGGGGGGRKLPRGPSEAKSQTPCPHGAKCKFPPPNCFYKHGNTPGVLEAQQKEHHGGGGASESSLASKVKTGSVYIVKEVNGKKRLFEQDGAEKSNTGRKKTKGKAGVSKVKQMGLAITTMCLLTVGCLFGNMADASMFNLLPSSPERKPTFKTAFTVKDVDASKLKPSGGNVFFARDTGCGPRGCCKNASHFFELDLRKDLNPIKTAGGQLLKVVGIGSIKLKVLTTTGPQVVIIRGVYFVPDLEFNVLSDRSFIEDGFKFCSDRESGSTVQTPDRQSSIKLEERDGLQLWKGKIVRKTGKHHAEAINDTDDATLQAACFNIVQKTALIDDTTVPKLLRALDAAGDSYQKRNPIRKALASLNVYTVNDPARDKILQAHAALGHCSPERLCKFLASHMTSAQIKRIYGEIAQTWCESCELAKVTRAKKTGKPMLRAKEFGKKTIYDVLGPYPNGRGTGYTYAVVFTDDATNYVTVRGMKDLKNIDKVLDDHFSWIETVQHKSIAKEEKLLNQGHVKILPPNETKLAHSDSASYFISTAAREIYKKHKVKHTQSSPYAQYQNKVERTIRTLKSSANAMILAADGIKGGGLDNSYWFFALARAAEVYNIVPTKTNGAFVSPQECITGVAPTLEHQLPFGSPCVALRMNRQKSDPAKGELGIWLGYNTNNHSHIIHCPRAGSRGAFRQTRHLRLPKRLLNKDLLTGKVPFDSEEAYVQFPLVNGGREGGGAANQTGNSTTATMSVEQQEAEQQEEDMPTCQDECHDDEVFVGFIAGADSGRTQFADMPVDESNYWDEVPEVPQKVANGTVPWSTEEMIDEDELIKNLHCYVDENTENDVYDNDMCLGIGKTYYNTKQAVKSENGDLFRESNRSEVTQLLERGVVRPVPVDDPRVRGQTIMPSIKFHQLKYREDGTIKAKSRWCAADKEGTAAGDSPTACATPAQTTIRLVIAETARVGGTLWSCDIPNAFDVGNEAATIAYMSAPPGEKEFDERGVEIVYECLNIYGRTDACRKYQGIFHRDLTGMGGKRSKNDPCLYKFPAKHGRGKIVLVAWIDDLIISTQCPKARKWIEAQLKAKYERLKGDDIKFRKSEHILGLDVTQNHKGIHISQHKLVDELLAHYKMTECNGTRTPVPTGTKVSKEDCPEQPLDCDYRHGVAVILYLSTVSRPDLCYAASQLGRVQSAPGKPHMKTMFDVLRYLKKTRNHGLLYKRGNRTSQAEVLDAYADASWCDNGVYTIASGVDYATLPRDNGKSSGGYIVRYNGAPIEFKSKVINTVCLSTAESELKAAAECAKAVLHIRRLVEEITDQPITTPTTIYEDASAVIAQCEKTDYTIKSRVRHIGVAFWFLREQVQDALTIILKKVSTEDQLADITTKFLGRTIHERLKERLMVPA